MLMKHFYIAVFNRNWKENNKSARIVAEVSDEEEDETVMKLRNTEPPGNSIMNEILCFCMDAIFTTTKT